MKKIFLISLIILAGFFLIKTEAVKAHMETGNTSITTEQKSLDKKQNDDYMDKMMNRNMKEGKEGCMMGYGYNNMMSGFGLLGGLTWTAVIIFLLTGAYFFIKQAQKK